MAKIYIGLDIYSNESLNDIIESKKCDGVILGDLFCDNRMFENGNNDLVKYFDILSKTEMDIIYQLPYYITSRNRTQILNNLKTLYSLKPDAIILVADVGFADFIRKTFTSFKLAWSNMQRNRENKTNTHTYEFLKQLGIDYIETAEKDKIQIFKNYGLSPWLIYGYTTYKTFGRICYVQQQLSKCLPECRKLCVDAEYSLIEEKSGYELTLDGYIMGKKLVYIKDLLYKSAESETVCIYAKTYKELQEIFKEIKNEKI